MFYKMDVFTNLLGPVAVPLMNIYNENILNKNNKTNSHLGGTAGINTVAEDGSKNTSVVSTQNLEFLNNLSTEELNVLLQKYFSFDYTDEPSQKIIEWFIILLSIPCITMFCVLITQNIGIILKLFIACLTIIHIVLVTFYIHNTFHQTKLNNTATAVPVANARSHTNQLNAIEKYKS